MNVCLSDRPLDPKPPSPLPRLKPPPRPPRPRGAPRLDMMMGGENEKDSSCVPANI